MENASQREKVALIAVVSVLLAALLFMFLIKPSAEARSATADKNDSLKTSQENMQNYISNKVQYKKSLSDAKSNLKNSAGSFYGDLTTEQIDDILTYYVLQSSLSPNSLNITVSGTSSLSKYSSASTGTETTAASSATTTTTAASGAQASGDIMVMKVSLSAIGQQNNLLNLLNALESDPAIFISDYSLSNDASDTSKSTITVNLYLYMCATD